ncbi:WD40 repeat domain-containing protein [Okeanomitos corallinicola TIOX110]|uniref:WD40 repeat domain-containing protein n=1 Tax=Okeanomitos corallinicola TIOX110 TaxID=3133117 RepID=A0ABZ2UYM0_9CYAN
MRTEGRREGKTPAMMSNLNWAILAAVMFSMPMVYNFDTNAAQAAKEVKINSSENISFTQPRLLRTLKGHTGTVKSLNFSPNGKILVSGGSNNEPIIRFWNPENGKKLATINRAHQGSVDSILISPDAKTLVSCGSDYRINLWNLQTLEFSRAFDGHTSPVLSLVTTPDSKILVSGGLDGIRLWDLQKQLPLATLVRYDNIIYTLAISPDGQTLASGDNKGIVKLWDLKSRQLIKQLKVHSQVVTGLTFTPNGETLVSASGDKTIKIWNINNGEQLQTFTGHNFPVNAIAINADGKTLASAAQDGIKLWDLTTGELKNPLTETNNSASAWTQPTKDIAFSTDGTMLASGGMDDKINIWLNR